MRKLQLVPSPIPSRIATLAFTLAAIGPLSAGCGKNEEAAGQFRRTQRVFVLQPDSVVSARLDNGVFAYVQRESSRPEAAIEVLYRAGPIHEPRGKATVSRVLPVARVYAGTSMHEKRKAFEELTRIGRVNAEVAGDHTHFDYIMPRNKAASALDAEIERLTSAQFDE